MAGHRLFESRNLSQAAGFLGACLSRAQHRTAGMETATSRDVSRVLRLAGQNLMGPAAIAPMVATPTSRIVGHRALPITSETGRENT